MDLHSRPRQRKQDPWAPREQAAGPAPLQQVGVRRGGQLPRGRSYSALTFSKKPNCVEGGKQTETRSRKFRRHEATERPWRAVVAAAVKSTETVAERHERARALRAVLAGESYPKLCSECASAARGRRIPHGDSVVKLEFAKAHGFAVVGHRMPRQRHRAGVGEGGSGR